MEKEYDLELIKLIIPTLTDEDLSHLEWCISKEIEVREYERDAPIPSSQEEDYGIDDDIQTEISFGQYLDARSDAIDREHDHIEDAPAEPKLHNDYDIVPNAPAERFDCRGEGCEEKYEQFLKEIGHSSSSMGTL